MRSQTVTPGGEIKRIPIKRKDKDLHEVKSRHVSKGKDWLNLPRHIPTPDRAQRGRRYQEKMKKESPAE